MPCRDSRIAPYLRFALATLFLLRTGQLGSVKAGRRRLIGKHHLQEFLAK